MVPRQTVPLAVLRFSTQSGPSYTMWFRQFTKNVTKTDHIEGSHPHSTEHDAQPITYLKDRRRRPEGGGVNES
jgi:hypothetical protein